MSLIVELGACPVCGGRDLSLNSEGLVVCRSCGTVLGPAVAAGPSASKKLADYVPLEGGTEYDWRDVRGIVTPKFKIYRAIAKRPGSRISAEVERLGSYLGLPKVCIHTGESLAARVGRAGDVEYTAAAILFISCRLAKIYADHMFKDYDVRRLARRALWVQRTAGISMPPPPPKYFMFKIAEELGVDKDIVKNALDILRLIMPVVGRGKIAQAAAFLLSARAHGYKLEPKDVANAAMISEKSLLEALREVDAAFRPLDRGRSRPRRS
ncbi:MAG: TFIIB-type zinc finger domain-containing protein [Thermoproteus sp.]